MAGQQAGKVVAQRQRAQLQPVDALNKVVRVVGIVAPVILDHSLARVGCRSEGIGFTSLIGSAVRLSCCGVNTLHGYALTVVERCELAQTIAHHKLLGTVKHVATNAEVEQERERQVLVGEGVVPSAYELRFAVAHHVVGAAVYLVKTGCRVDEILAALYLVAVGIVFCLEACAHERHELAAVRYRCRLYRTKLCIGGIEHTHAIEEVAQTTLIVREVEGRLPLKVFTIKGFTREAHLHTFVDNRARVDRHHDVTAGVRETWRSNLVLSRAVIVGPIQSQSAVQEAQLSTNLPCGLNFGFQD